MSEIPFFSVIVPVYNVEGLLRDCFQSILRQTLQDFELIAVEDCSTDSSRRLLRELAEDYPIKVIELAENKGLANARNVGLSAANGEYVLFVDSDDEIEPDLLDVVHSVCHDSDVVIFNFYREWFSGNWRKNMMTPLLEELSQQKIKGDEIEKKAKIFSNFNVAWNKAYRREFLLKHKFSFDDGFYEDIAFNYKVIILASAICVTPYLGYKYRQREGSILGARSDRHKDLTRQYYRLYTFLMENRHSSYYVTATEVFVRHLFNLLVRQNYRLTKSAQKSLVAEFKRIFKVFNVEEFFKPQSVTDRIKLEYLKHATPQSNRIFSVLSSLAGILTKQRLLRLKTLLFMTIKYALYQIVFSRLPIKENLAVFEAYWGESYSCNPRAISEYLENNSDLEIVWFGKKKEKMYVGKNKYIGIKTLRYFYYMGVAKYFVSNANFPDFYRKRHGTVHLQTKHGTPLKLMGCDELRKKSGEDYKNRDILFKKFANRCRRWDFVISSNSYSTEVWRKSFPYEYKTIEFGYPRNDYIINNRKNSELIKKIKRQIGVSDDDDRELLLFMPTFREYHKSPTYYLSLGRFAKMLSSKYLIVVRAHYFNAGKANLDGIENIIDATDFDRIEELYLAADLLLTDYSSSMFDFANLNKPIVLFLPDFEEYKEKRGMYFDIRTFSPGLFAYTETDLIELLLEGRHLQDESLSRIEKFRKKFCSFDDGKATAKVCKQVFQV